MSNWDLGALADPTKFHDPIAVRGRDVRLLQRQLEMMLKIRMVEQHLAAKRRDGSIGGPVHLGVGQEAIAVGVTACLKSTDRVFGGHRSHSHLLALGGDIYGLFAEVLGKNTGLSKGMGGSMHLWSQSIGFYGSVPIVAGTVSLAVGAGLAASLSDTDALGVTYFGDGAVEEGVVHESLNLARVMKLPVLFVVENNLFSSHLHISLRQPSNSTARFASAHEVSFEVVDGNDVTAVQDATARLTERARNGEGPVFLEAITQRWYGHVDWREDIDVGVNRSMDDLVNWKKRDPIKRLLDGLDVIGVEAVELRKQIEERIATEIDRAWAAAVADPYPQPEALLKRVYATSNNA